MAKLRDLKKDVNYLTSEFISQAFFTQYLFPETKEKAISAVIEKAILFRTETLAAINNKKEGEQPKAYYRALQEEFLKKYYDLLNELDSLKK